MNFARFVEATQVRRAHEITGWSAAALDILSLRKQEARDLVVSVTGEAERSRERKDRTNFLRRGNKDNLKLCDRNAF